MRRFLIWSGLSALIGLILAIGGVWAYNHFYVRFQPVAIDRNQDEIQSLLDSASWVSEGGGGQPVYVVGYRDSEPTLAYMQQEAPKLHAGGADVRAVLFARPDEDGEVRSNPAERAAIAELWLSRDWNLYQRWIATPTNEWTAQGLAPADGNLARTAVAKGSQEFARRLSDLLRTAGVRTDWPLVIWRDREGFLKVCACSDQRSWAFIRDDLGAPETLRSSDDLNLSEGLEDTGAETPNGDEYPGQPLPQATTAPSGEVPLPYPRLPATPPAQVPAPSASSPQITTGAPTGTTAGATTAAPAPARPAPGRRLERQPPRPSSGTSPRPAPRAAPRPTPRPAPPKAVQDEDTRFY